MEDGRSMEKFAGFLAALGILFGLSVKIKCKYLFDPSDWGGGVQRIGNLGGWIKKNLPKTQHQPCNGDLSGQHISAHFAQLPPIFNTFQDRQQSPKFPRRHSGGWTGIKIPRLGETVDGREKS